FPGIGAYDKWAIEWGYKPIFGTKNAEEDKKILNQWTLKHVGDPQYWFGTEQNSYDPRSQSEDLGNNAMQASTYGIKNLKRIVPGLKDWYKEDAENYAMLSEMYGQVISQYRRYMGHVTKNVGGIYETPKTYDTDGAVYEPVTAATQREAVAFLNKQLFETPTWLLDKRILSLIRPGSGVDQVRVMQEAIFNSLFDYARMGRLIEGSAGNANAYSLDNLFTDMQRGIWSELPARQPIDNFRRNLQKVYVERMALLINPASTNAPAQGGVGNPAIASPVSPDADPKKSDVISLARGHLNELKNEITAAIPAYGDKMSKYHLQDVLARINNALEPKK
ncbi:MAG TPA: zinc-dependent metalloprotease, partial [Cyclobacteriaceae bacterium]|nr:zinc-dependent metalloprotease [Cyclobacteriaceae bacterium]